MKFYGFACDGLPLNESKPHCFLFILLFYMVFLKKTKAVIFRADNITVCYGISEFRWTNPPATGCDGGLSGLVATSARPVFEAVKKRDGEGTC